MKSCVLLVCVFCLGAWVEVTAAEKETTQLLVPQPRGQFSEQEQESALRALGKTEKSVVSFVTYLPEVSCRVWRPDPKSSHTRVDLTSRIGADYIVELWFDVVFDEKFTKAVESHCVLFGAIVRADVAKLKPGEVGTPLSFSLGEIDALCDDWDAFLAQKQKSRREKKS